MNLNMIQQNDHMVLLEFFVERVVFNDKVDPDLQSGRTTIDFQFLDNDPIVLESPVTESSWCSSQPFNFGKTCLFSLTPAQAKEATQLFDLYVRVYQNKKCGLPRNDLIGIALIPLTNLFKDVLKKSGDKSTESPPGASKFLRNSVPLTDVEDYPTPVGYLCTSVRLTCFGKFIQTDFRMNMDQNSIDYKANEAQYRLKYHKKYEPCPEVCGPSVEIPCASPKTCGLSNPAIDPTPLPQPPDLRLSGKKDAKRKGSKGAKGGKRGKGGKGGKKGGKGSRGKKSASTVNPGSCKTDASCPDTCPTVNKYQMEQKCKEELAKLQATAIPSPCPMSCYEKQAQSHVRWNDCPPSCPSAPDPDPGDCPDCCPVNKELSPKPCPNPDEEQGLKSCPPSGACNAKTGQEPPCCSYLTTQPGQPLGPQTICPRPECSSPTGRQGGNQQYASAFYLDGSGPNAVRPGQVSGNCTPKPVTMMYASEPNYGRNPPMDNFQINMGQGGSLCCRIHDETVPGQTPCPVNYMPPPTLDGKCPFDCKSGQTGPSPNNNGPMGLPYDAPCPQTCAHCGPPCRRIKQPQVVEMRPGINEETPFRLCVGDGAIDQNQLCVSPPTYTADDGTKYTEISDPRKQVFVMRIGKKYEGAMGGRNNVDLHLTTPPPPDPEPDTTCTFIQYNASDAAPGSKYVLGAAVATAGDKKSNKGGKKDKGAAKKNADEGLTFLEGGFFGGLHSIGRCPLIKYCELVLVCLLFS